MPKKHSDALEKFWDELHYTKVRCPWCGNRLPSRNDDGVTPGHCLNLCTLPHGDAMKFNAILHECDMKVKKEAADKKAMEELLRKENDDARST
jgi:hypothetical protein